MAIRIGTPFGRTLATTTGIGDRELRAALHLVPQPIYLRLVSRRHQQADRASGNEPRL